MVKSSKSILKIDTVAPHTRSVDWNNLCDDAVGIIMSLLIRGVWIEIRTNPDIDEARSVAPHTRSVDWNISQHDLAKTEQAVAPHTRSVDWNSWLDCRSGHWPESLLIRGVWIEIGTQTAYHQAYTVAPHTRSVDWNAHQRPVLQAHIVVAPHTRSVDL